MTDQFIIAATASSTFSSEVAINAFDGTVWSWTSSTNSGWIMAQLNTASVVNSYNILRRDDVPGRNPVTWTFEGSNNGTTFTTLDTRTGITWPTAGQTQVWTFINSTAYLYYRLNVTVNNGDTLLSVCELGLSGVTTIIATASEQYPTETAPLAIDTNTSTHWTTNGSMAAWLRLDYGSSRSRGNYVIYPLSDAYSIRNPKTWTWEGSNDGTTWTVLDTQTNYTWTLSTPHTFACSNTTAYRFYRINITLNQNGSGYTSIAELSTSASKSVAFDPATLAGKRLWLRAKDNVGANGSAITTWVDQSGTNHDGTAIGTSPTVATAATQIGGKAVQFGGAGYFDLGNVMARAIVTASSEFNATAEAAVNLADGDVSTAWASAAGVPQWSRFEVPTTLAPATGYTITGNAAYPNDAPKNWTFEGSTNGIAWTVLDTRTGIIFSGSTAQTFTFSNTTPYRYYRLNISLTNSTSVVRIAELSMNSLLPYLTPGEMWVVVKSTSTNIGFLDASSGGGLAQVYPFTDGNIYESFGRASRPSFTPTLGLTSWRVYRVANDGTTWQAWLDGVSQSTASSVVANWIANWRLGIPQNSQYFVGSIAEILVRSQISTAQEVTDITAYLQAEHFVAATVPPRLARPTIMSRVAIQQASRW